MKSSQPIHDSIADEQAALWAARLDGDTLDGTQRAELDAWLAQKPHHRALLSEYCQFSADLEEQIPTLVSAGAVTMPASAPKRRWWTLPRISTFVFAAATAVAVMVVLLRPVPQLETVAMASGQRGERTLADGTRVELNANTSLRFENNTSERRVRLVGGEALFNVTKDPSRPFFVDTPAGSVRVTGTTFNVRTEPNAAAFEVTVVEGSVQVSPADSNSRNSPATMALGAGDQYSSRAGGVRPLTAKELEDALAWRQGKIVFDDTPLSDAAARFSHYHGRAIHVAAEVANEPLGGRYSIDDLSGFLAALEQVLPRVKIHTDYQSGAISINGRP